MVWLLLLIVSAGIGLLASSLPSIHSILKALKGGDLYRRWNRLRWLVVGFIMAYVVYGSTRFATVSEPTDLLGSLILLAGGFFVLAVARLSALTTQDLVRIAILERDVVRDPLTGTFNRRYLDTRLDEEISRSRRSGLPLSTLMIDLDHFKGVNDFYGHLVGDQVLRHVSSLIQSQVRLNDIVVRYGGEEFVVITPDSSLEDAARLGHRLLRQLRDHSIDLPNGDTLAVTASIGAATLAEAEGRTTFLRRADDALYEAKRGGRDRLCVAGRLAEESPA
ncbi:MULTISPECIES: GGDEF domain-containing protein [unclassified Sphingobium]|uniref:GGDEF domain-containing protein n=1 Tax=unclassified Sphingobium TaxID=2611147 RepID=UPI0022247629|nr:MULTISPECIES: GGDEF domain-containing protein [unclassified Sphingobium]MCW2412113.1 diguanylate cyclase (GGDEF)-like protein [Sphingobium sp. B8D3D]MCW2415590.1 diguanylate cyclase (GGDEF)-like protein [Sphingobium sp. B8D3A]